MNLCMFRTVHPSSGVFHCTHSNGICHTGLLSRSICSCSQPVSKPVWHIPLLCVQWKTPDDGRRKCTKHAEFHYKIKKIWEISISSWFYYTKFLMLHGHMNVKFHNYYSSTRKISFYIFNVFSKSIPFNNIFIFSIYCNEDTTNIWKNTSCPFWQRTYSPHSTRRGPMRGGMWGELSHSCGTWPWLFLQRWANWQQPPVTSKMQQT